MKKSAILIYTCSLLFSLIFTSSLHAQSFFGYQTIGRHTVFFSVAWQGKPVLGMGYNIRTFGRTFTDWQAELRFPLDAMYTFDNYQLITGFYKPITVKRAFMGTGVHLRWQNQTNTNEKTSLLSLALTALPTYTYAASLNDGAYGTAALRATYAPVIYAKKGSQTQFLAAHRVEAGGHLDLHYERTAGLGLNGFGSRSFILGNSILDADDNWAVEGDFYFGTTYNLRRD